MHAMIVNAYGRSNRGDSVLLDECIEEIKYAFSEPKLTCAVFEGQDAARAVHGDVEWTERIGNTSHSGPIAKAVTLFRLLAAALATVPGLKFTKTLLPVAQQRTWDAIRSADYVISAPGGYIHDTNFAYYVALLHIWLGSRANSTVMLAPQSVGPIDSRIARGIARYVLSKVPVICARESYTARFLSEDLRLSQKIIQRTGDSAFWNFAVSTDDSELTLAKCGIGIHDHQKEIFGITVVNWNFPKAEDPSASSDNYVKEMASVIDHISSKYRLQPVIFNQVSEDLPMAKRIATACSSEVLVDVSSREPEVLRALISKSKVFLGTRFHSCIFSMMAGRPTCAISYLPKTKYILGDLGLQHRQVSIDNIKSADVLAIIEYDLDNIDDAEDEIEDAVANYRSRNLRMRDLLSK